jgi:hypothetical protein
MENSRFSEKLMHNSDLQKSNSKNPSSLITKYTEELLVSRSIFNQSLENYPYKYIQAING